MKKQIKSTKMLLLVFALLILGGQGTHLFAQGIRTERVSFQKGTSSATIEGTVRGDELIDYLLNVRNGQYMNVSMTTNNGANYFNIMEPGEEYEAVFNGSVNENQFEGTTAKSGDYRIRVYLMRSAARRGEQANYRLEMNVSGSGNSENPVTSGDATVAGTNFNATGNIPCKMQENQATTVNCKFGVIRRGNGDADVQVTASDGTVRFIYFQNGEAVGYDKSDGDKGEFQARKASDLYIIHIGNELYEIPEAVIYGG